MLLGNCGEVCDDPSVPAYGGKVIARASEMHKTSKQPGHPAARAVGAVGAMGEGVLDRSKLRPLGRALIEPAEGTSGCVSVLTLWVPPGLARTAGAKIC